MPCTLLMFSKDARLPEQLQRAMAAEAEAAREARAKVGNVTGKWLLSTPNLPGDSGRGREEGRAASETISESPAALQLRYLQVWLWFAYYKTRHNLASKHMGRRQQDGIYPQ